MPEPHYLSFLLSKLHFSQYLSRFSGPSRPVPVFTAVDRPRRSRRRHHRGEPLVLIFFLKGKIFLLVCLHRYLYYFLTFIIASYIVRWFWYPPPSALVLSMIRMWYILSFHNYWFIYCLWQLSRPTWHRFYLSRRLLNRKFQPTILSRG